jgi:hypothetical protein
MPNEHDRIARLLNQSPTRLYIELALESPEHKGALYSEAQSEQIGRGIFQRLEQQLFEVVCTKWRYCAKHEDPRFFDSVTLVASLADIISVTVTGVPPFVVAALLFKIGLETFCKCQPATPAKAHA